MCVNNLFRVVMRCENFRRRKQEFNVESRREQLGIKINSNRNGNGIGNWYTEMRRKQKLKKKQFQQTSNREIVLRRDTALFRFISLYFCCILPLIHWGRSSRVVIVTGQ